MKNQNHHRYLSDVIEGADIVPDLQPITTIEKDRFDGFIDWLKKVPFAENICYMDVTLRVTDENHDENETTFLLTPDKELGDYYETMLNEYVKSGYSIFPHKEFRNGLVDDKKFVRFFSNKFDVDENSIDTPKVDGTVNFVPKIIDFEKIIKNSNEVNLKNNEEESAQIHFNKWIDINNKYRTQLLSTTKNKLRYVIVMPIGFFVDNKFDLKSAIYLGLDESLDDNNIDQILTWITNGISFSSFKYTLYRNKKNIEKIRTKSILNAIASVMARNQSHNMGSHVLSKLVTSDNVDLNTITEKNKPFYKSYLEGTWGEYRKNEIDTRFQKLNKKYYKKNKVADLEAPIRVTINNYLKEQAQKKFYNKITSNFYSYLKTRQDFLADVVSGRPEVQSTKMFVQDLIGDIDKNHLLLNRISGVDNFKFSFKIKGKDSSGKEIISFEKTNEEETTTYKIKDDVHVAITNDVVGQHAFYIILENIIRNSAKHGKKIDKDKFEFLINLKGSELDKSKYQITISDDIHISNEKKILIRLKRIEKKYTPKKEEIHICKNEKSISEDNKIPEKFHRYFLDRTLKHDNEKQCELEYVCTEKDKHENFFDYYRISEIDKLVLMQNSWINEPILTDNLELREGALGLIEMETCAAYMRRIPVDYIDHPDYALKFSKEEIKNRKVDVLNGKKKHRILRAVKVENKTRSESYLGYRFYIHKPKRLLIIDEKGDIWEELLEWAKRKNNGNNRAENEKQIFSFLKTFEDNGIMILNANKDDVFDWKDYKFNKNRVYQHEILLIDSECNDLYNCLESKYKLAHLPTRIVSMDDFKDQIKSYYIDDIKNNSAFFRDKKLDDLKINDFYGVSGSNTLVVEVWRAYVDTIRKNIYFDKDIYDLLFNISEEENKEKVLIKFDDHGFDYPQWKDNWSGGFNQIYSSNSKLLVDRARGEDEDPSGIHRLKAIETVLCNVAIIDERIQKITSNNTYSLKGHNNKITFRDQWNYTHVFVPEKDESKNGIDLNAPSFNNEYDTTINNILKKEFKDSIRKTKGLSYLVIHLGIIEKILSAQGKLKDCQENRRKLINRLIEGFDSCEVIITSGRAPRDLPEDYRFLSYSILSKYLIEDRFKQYLLEVLAAARPKSKT